ncbi:Vgb family protein [Wenzhouxiangella sp. EGI_FJ10305]|uniref:Vgb family protein n=1 Tax=Wenzhouxiangella sp. EGI_FJ10305 TaxID=3243768 RepID=UPI0035D7CD7F
MRNFLIPLLIALMSTGAVAQDDESVAEVEIREWQVPWESSRPRDPDVAADDRIWFVGQGDDYVAVFDPDTEDFKRYDLPEGAGPHNVIVTEDQEIWYAGNRAAHLGKLDPESGDIEQVATPEERAADPHTLIEDSSGRIWFTSQWSNHIGRYDRDSGEIELVGVSEKRSRPYGIVLDDNDNAWVALFGTNKLGRVDAESFELTEIELPREDARPRRLALTDTGLYYGDYNKGYLGHLDPESREITEWRMPGEDKSGAYAMAADDKGRVWFVETWQDPNRFVGFDPETESFFAMGEVPSGGGTVRHMVFDAETNSIWFGTDTNYLGRAELP